MFGEGMKVGALALLRIGVAIDMFTSEERWSFQIAEDPAFGEKVLSVFTSPQQPINTASMLDKARATNISALLPNNFGVLRSGTTPGSSPSPRVTKLDELVSSFAKSDKMLEQRIRGAVVRQDAATVRKLMAQRTSLATSSPSASASAVAPLAGSRGLRLRSDDTITVLTGVSLHDWHTFAARFLFLEPPTNVARARLGTLLLDERCRGQLFVKGVYITSLANDGMATGANFNHLKLDRDRRAVVHKGDINSQLSAMWMEVSPCLSRALNHALGRTNLYDIQSHTRAKHKANIPIIPNQGTTEAQRPHVDVLESSQHGVSTQRCARGDHLHDG